MNNRIFKEQWLLPSLSNPDKPHKVSLKHDGSYVCSCWPFRKSEETPRTCIHIENVQTGLIISEQAKERASESTLRYYPQFHNVAQVELNEIRSTEVRLKVPLIPADNRGTHMDATIVYDLLKRFNMPLSQVMELDRHSLRKNSLLAVINYVEAHGRMVWAVDPEGNPTSEIVIIPIYKESA